MQVRGGDCPNPPSLSPPVSDNSLVVDERPFRVAFRVGFHAKTVHFLRTNFGGFRSSSVTASTIFVAVDAAGATFARMVTVVNLVFRSNLLET